mgnify:CR=1 FL=1
MIEVQHLTKRYGRVTAVDDVSFRVERGEILGFLGPNGAGKTTTIRMLVGLARPDRGRVTIRGLDQVSLRVTIAEIRREIAKQLGVGLHDAADRAAVEGFDLSVQRADDAQRHDRRNEVLIGEQPVLRVAIGRPAEDGAHTGKAAPRGRARVKACGCTRREPQEVAQRPLLQRVTSL